MRHVLLLSVLTVLLTCLRLPADEEDKPKTTGTRYALLIGVSKYDSKHLNDLDYADKDVEDLAEALKQSSYKASNITLLNTKSKGKSPTAKRIKQELEKFLKRNYDSKDVVLIAFSGHGIQVGQRFYFCPAGARIDKDEKSRDKNLISIDELYQQLGKCKAGSRVVLTDACRNDPTRKVPDIPVRISYPAKPRYDRGLPDDVFFFASCKPGTRSYESKELGGGRGVFFHFVIEGLKGKADLDGDMKVTRTELETYVRSQMAKHDRRQIPQVLTKSTDDPEIGEIKPIEDEVLRPVANLPRQRGVNVPTLACSTDGKWAASDDKGLIQTYDLEKRRLMRKWRCSGQSSVNPVFFKVGTVAVGELNGTAAYSVAGVKVGARKIKNRNVSSIALARDQRHVAIGDSQGTLTVLDGRGAVAETFDHGNEGVWMAAFAPGAGQILSGTDRGKMYLWDVGKGRQIHSLSGHKSGILAGLVTPDGKVALSVAHKGYLIRWDLKTGKAIDTLDVRVGREWPWSASFTQDGRQLMVGGDAGTVSFWSIPSLGKGKPKFRASYSKHRRGCSVAIAADGSRAISAADAELYVYEPGKD